MSAVALRRAAWRHPEAVAGLLAAGAWIALLAPVAGGALGALHDRVHAQAPALAAGAGWLLMAAAMMVPGALPAARRLALGGLWRRRGRTVTLFLAGYLGVWASFGAVVLPAVALLATAIDRPVLLAVALAAAAGWELAPAKWRLLRACHLLAPVPPAGRRADTRCVAEGARNGRWCAGACGPMMLAMAVAGHERLGLMVLLAVIVVAEKGALRPSPLACPAAAALALAAVIALAG